MDAVTVTLLAALVGTTVSVVGLAFTVTTGLRRDVAALATKVTEGLADVRAEVADVRAEVGEVRAELGELRGELAAHTAQPH